MPLRSYAGLDRTSSPAEVPDFAAVDPCSTGDERARLDRIDQYALAAAREALPTAGSTSPPAIRPRVAVVIAATSLGAMPLGERYQRARHDGVAVRRAAAPRTSLCRDRRAPGADARRARTRLSPSIACASGTQAVGLALRADRARPRRRRARRRRRSAVRLRRRRLQRACAPPPPTPCGRSTRGATGSRSAKARRCWWSSRRRTRRARGARHDDRDRRRRAVRATPCT